MIQKIIVLMFVLVFMAQGVSAESFVLSTDGSATDCGSLSDNGLTAPANYSANIAITQDLLDISTPRKGWFGQYSSTTGGCAYTGQGPLFGWTDWQYSPISASSTGVTSVTYNYMFLSGIVGTVVISNDAPNLASGESCDGLGTFTVYTENQYSFTDSNNGNYSFTVFNGIDYQINYTNGNISEWHNFTASGDETWNPNCGIIAFTNLAYTSPVKQYLTSNVTIDINDTDGTIASSIVRIDGSNYSMQFIGGEKWRYLFTGTNIIKNYYITNIYATDNEGVQDSESYNASYIHVESRTGGGGGGGDSYPPDPTIPPSSEPCTLNCDDNDDGICDRNCDIDDDGICDVNCDDAADRPIDEDVPDDFRDLFEDFRDGDIPDDFWTDKNLRIHPASLNSTAFYTGWDKPQNITYRFLTNKFIDTCEVTDGTCTIDQRFLVNFNTVIDGNTTGYRGMLTVSRTNETAQADIKINVINLCACKEITPWQLNISDEWAQKLVYFVRVKDGAIVCIRWWAMIALLILLLGIVWYDSNKK